MTSSLFDVGAQAERTALAWQRTGLGLLAVGALLLHEAGGGLRALAVVVGLADVATGAVLSVVIARLRYRRTLASVTAGRTPVARRSCVAVTACAIATAIAAAVQPIAAL